MLTIFSYQKTKNGFTLIELMVVVLVIAILATILLPRLSKARAQAEFASCKSTLRSLQTELAKHFALNGQYPINLKDLDAPAKLQVCPGDGSYSYHLDHGSFKVECNKHGFLLTEDGIEVFDNFEPSDPGSGSAPGSDPDPGDYPVWNSNRSYRGGEYVVYDGRLFRARYYASPGQVPGMLGSPWQEITDEWRNFNVYEEGDTVIYNGRTFQARHWTQNQEPGLLSSPWQELTDEWRFFNVYREGDEVFYNGKKYRAKYYSQNEQPDSSDAWELVDD